MKRTHNMSPEARAAAGERMRKMHEARRSKALIPNGPTNIQAVEKREPVSVEETDEEFQARRARERAERLASYNLTGDDQNRLAKLAGIQSAVIASDPKAVEAVKQHTIERELEASHIQTLPPPRIGSREVSLIVRTDGTMVSQWGPCICGKAKREWHTICLKENGHV